MSITTTDINTYNADGRIIQVEYAMKAMNLGTTTVGVALEECIILISEKKLGSKLQIAPTVKKHFKIYDTIACGTSGISGDAPTIINKCRRQCIQHEQTFNEQIPTEKLMRGICALALKFGEDDCEKKIFSRPFGVSALVGSYSNRPRLYCIDPSGSYLAYKAHCIGAAQEVVESILEESYSASEDKSNCIRRMLGVLKDVMKDKISQFNVEVSCVDKSGVVMLTPDEILTYLQ